VNVGGVDELSIYFRLDDPWCRGWAGEYGVRDEDETRDEKQKGIAHCVISPVMPAARRRTALDGFLPTLYYNIIRVNLEVFILQNQDLYARV